MGPVDGPDAWDGYRAALVAETVLLSMAQGTPISVEPMAVPELYKPYRSAFTNSGTAE